MKNIKTWAQKVRERKRKTGEANLRIGQNVNKNKNQLCLSEMVYPIVTERNVTKISIYTAKEVEQIMQGLKQLKAELKKKKKLRANGRKDIVFSGLL